MYTRPQRYDAGQSLIEVLIGLGISVIMITAATGSLYLVLRSGNANEQNQVAGSLASALLDNATALVQSSWLSIYNLQKGSSDLYFLATSTGQFAVTSGQENVTIGGIAYQRSFYIENVSRALGTRDIQTTYDSANDDPSTQKITVQIVWGQSGASTLQVVSYLTRWNLRFTNQTDWRGGTGFGGPVTEFGDRFSSTTGINVSPTYATGSIKLIGF